MTATIDVTAERSSANPPAGLPRLLAGDGPTGLTGHLRRHGPLPYRGGPGLLISTVAAAGLTGRGGAAFPTARKLSAVADAGRRPVVVGNAAEGEPASDKDKRLLWFAPHLVLDGLQLAAEAVDAAAAYLYAYRHPRLQDRLSAALAERAAAGTDRVGVRCVDAPARFLAGEESALANRLTGGPALPWSTPPRVYQRGVSGAPTLVLNAETLAHLALLSRHGAGWFRQLGTPAEPGSTLVTLHRPGRPVTVTEVALGTPIAELLDTDPAATGAVLVGGYHGGWLAARAADGGTLANAALGPMGLLVGAGVLAELPADRCGLAETARVVRYLAAESAGQCGPCLNGLPRIAAALAELAGPRPAAETHRALLRWAGLVDGRGGCRHPDGTVRLVRSALQVFADELAVHTRGRCTATDRRPFLPVPAATPGRAADWR